MFVRIKYDIFFVSQFVVSVQNIDFSYRFVLCNICNEELFFRTFI